MENGNPFGDVCHTSLNGPHFPLNHEDMGGRITKPAPNGTTFESIFFPNFPFGGIQYVIVPGAAKLVGRHQKECVAGNSAGDLFGIVSSRDPSKWLKS